MKSRQRFFDGTCLKKDITRFAPAWALYLIGGVMIGMSVLSEVSAYSSGVIDAVNALGQSIGIFSILNMIYAMVIAQLLYGDMFNSKLCNALHAMPLRREAWFLTHLVSGLLFSLVPNLVISLSILPYLDEFWYTGFLWLLGMEMHYLFFFGLAVFSMFCTGSRFASITVYGLLNFLSLLAAWFAYTIYVPMLYGFTLDETAFLPFSPVVELCRDPNYFRVEHLSSCICMDGSGDWYLHSSSLYISSNIQHAYVWDGLGDSWGYLGILTAIGAVLLVLALVLYKKRRLESAGSFVAFRVMKPMFWVVFAMGCGGVCEFFVAELLGHNGDVTWLFLGIGLVVGYFVGQMLLERTVKVFKRRAFLQFAVFLAAFGLSLLVTWLDPLGVTRYIPDADKVEKVYVSDSAWNYETLEYYESNNIHFRWYKATDPQGIEKARQVHSLLIDEGRVKSYNSVTVCYVLKNGQVVMRHYAPGNGGKADTAIQELMKFPQAIIGCATLEELKANVSDLGVSRDGYVSAVNVDGDALEACLEVLWKDIEAGNFLQDESYHEKHGCGKPSVSLIIRFQNGYGKTFYLYDCCKNSVDWVENHVSLEGSMFHTMTLEYLQQKVTRVDTSMGRSFAAPEDSAMIAQLLQKLQKDLSSYGASCSKPVAEGNFETVTVYLEDGISETLFLTRISSTQEHLEAIYASEASDAVA